MIDLDLEDNSLDVKGTIYMCDMLKENCYITDLVSKIIVKPDLSRHFKLRSLNDDR